MTSATTPEELKLTIPTGLLSFPVIAVGTRVTPRPPHRSVRAQLRHTAPTSGG